MENIKKLLSDGNLPEEIVSSLQEAFDKKVEEVREQAEMTIREDFARRYEHDKEVLVEAVDRMLTDAVQKQADEKAREVGKFVEARNAFRKGIKESKRTYRTKLDEQALAARTAVSTKLKEEILKLREQKKVLHNERMRFAEKYNAVKESLTNDHVKRVRKIDEFVVRQVTKELTEFQQDQKALVATRLKLVKEGRKKLNETQSRFVKQAASKVERVINETLKTEMSQLHEDLERNRQNMFGRRIFESVAAEFMTSYLAEGTEMRKLQLAVEARDTELKEALSTRDAAVKDSHIALRKAKIAEDRVVRAKTLSELLVNLRGDKRQVMEGMLETVRTEALRESFNKLLPVVLDETTRVKSATPQRRVLSETRIDKPNVVSGEQRGNRLAEAVQAEAYDIDPEIAQVIRLAGITR